MVKRKLGGIEMDRTEALRNELYEICDKTNTSRTGIEHLIKYYIESLGWTEEKAIEYARSGINRMSKLSSSVRMVKNYEERTSRYH